MTRQTQTMHYCWWNKSCNGWAIYLSVNAVLYMPGGAGFLPSTLLHRADRESFLHFSDVSIQTKCCFLLERFFLGTFQKFTPNLPPRSIRVRYS